MRRFCAILLLASGCVETARETRSCPADLTLDVSERLVDTRRHPPWDARQYQKLRWPAEHGDPMRPAFFIEDVTAIEHVLALEAAQPTLVPAGFRGAVRERPRDAKLRLHMARCELANKQTRRRASYDAALALLLGAPASDAVSLMVESTKNGRGAEAGARCTSKSPCPSGQFCSSGECLTSTALAVSFVSLPETEIEDLLTRALLRGYYARHGEAVDKTDPFYWWAATRVHHCGEQLCSFIVQDSKNEVRFVEWDLRDGGTRKALAELPPEERKLHEQRQRCFEGTGVSTTAECLELCEQRKRGADVDCRAHCYQSCE